MAKKKHKFKINGDTMLTIVVSSLFFCVAITITGIVLACFQIDISSIVSSALLCFGTELGICGLMKIYDKNIEYSEERRRRRQEREDNYGQGN